MTEFEKKVVEFLEFRRKQLSQPMWEIWAALLVLIVVDILAFFLS